MAPDSPLARATPVAASALEVALWSNVVMGGSAGGWVVVASRLLGVPTDPLLVALAALLGVAFYSRDRLDQGELAADALTMPRRTAWVQRQRAPLEALVALAFVSAGALLALRPSALPPILGGLGFALSYTWRWLPWRGQRRSWKQLPASKMPFVALLWTLLCVGTVVAAQGAAPPPNRWLVAAIVTLLVMVQILTNDLRDAAGDRASGTASLPVLVGTGRAPLVGVLLAGLAARLAWPLSPLALPLVALYSAALLLGYQRERDNVLRPWIEAQGIVAALALQLLP